MGYRSKWLNTVATIADSSSPILNAPGMSRGLMPRDMNIHPFGSIPHAGPPTIKQIPRSEWEDRIKEMDDTKSSLWDLMDHLNFDVKYQNGIPYCWSHGITRAVEVRYAAQTNKATRLSATSIGCIIKNFRAQGGWGRDAIVLASERGICLESDWPENELKRQYDTPDNWARAADFKIDEWDELPQNDFDMGMSYLLNRIPFGIGLDWWGHLVCGMTPISNGDGSFSMGIDNSWGTSWGNNGRGILAERKARGDMCAPREIRTAA